MRRKLNFNEWLNRFMSVQHWGIFIVAQVEFSLIIKVLLQAKGTQDGQDFPLFALAEAIYMSWFTFELLVRLVS